MRHRILYPPYHSLRQASSALLPSLTLLTQEHMMIASKVLKRFLRRCFSTVWTREVHKFHTANVILLTEAKCLLWGGTDFGRFHISGERTRIIVTGGIEHLPGQSNQIGLVRKNNAISNKNSELVCDKHQTERIKPPSR
uniref:Uncharacterized protein n=1 Tax=Loa loa TaxID=7209 RepID=A0A1I7W0X9_LOALO